VSNVIAHRGQNQSYIADSLCQATSARRGLLSEMGTDGDKADKNKDIYVGLGISAVYQRRFRYSLLWTHPDNEPSGHADYVCLA